MSWEREIERALHVMPRKGRGTLPAIELGLRAAWPGDWVYRRREYVPGTAIYVEHTKLIFGADAQIDDREIYEVVNARYPMRFPAEDLARGPVLGLSPRAKNWRNKARGSAHWVDDAQRAILRRRGPHARRGYQHIVELDNWPADARTGRAW